MKAIALTDNLWAQIESHLPTYSTSIKGGRPRLHLKKVLEGIIYIKINKLPWRAAPEVFGSKTALNDYYREWAKTGFFHSLKNADLLFSDVLINVDFDWEKINALHTNSTIHS
ncbi:MAG: transposase [Bacteriovoracaceae bacterium]|nr:transposase [Bacteriovoracaceae bacterium]